MVVVVAAMIVVPSAKTFIHPTWIPIRTLAPEAIWAGMCAREFRFVLNKESIFIVSKLIVLFGEGERYGTREKLLHIYFVRRLSFSAWRSLEIY